MTASQRKPRGVQKFLDAHTAGHLKPLPSRREEAGAFVGDAGGEEVRDGASLGGCSSMGG